MPTATEVAACPKCGSALRGWICPRCSPVPQAGSRKPSTSLFPLAAGVAVLLFVVSIAIVTVVFLNRSLLQSTAYTSSLQTALSSPGVQSALGSGIQAKQPVFGFLFPFGGSQFAQWSAGKTGPQYSRHHRSIRSSRRWLQGSLQQTKA